MVSRVSLPPDRWVRHSPYSDPGRYRPLLDELDGDPSAVCEAARNVIGHYREEWTQLPPDRRSEVDSRWLERILELDQSRHPQPLTTPRPREDRVAGCCRDHTLFVVGALREHSVPARSRIGFAGYFTPGFHHDHVVVEHWAGDRWVRTDPELPDDDRRGFDPRDMPTGPGAPFETAAEVWRGIRFGRLDADAYGVLPGSQWRGEDFDARYLVYEVAHRFGDELLLWDDWDGVHAPDPSWLDHLAELLMDADDGRVGAEEELARLHDEDPRLHPGPSVVQYSPFGDHPQEVSLTKGLPKESFRLTNDDQ
jgi:hypothetical protein